MREAIISFPFLGLTVDPPYCIEIGPFCIYYYGIIIAVGFLLAVFYASRVHDRFDISMDDVYDYIIWGTVAGVICARLYYCLTYTDAAGVHTYLKDPASFLRIRDGGLAIYGGVIGAILALVIRSRMKKQSVFPILDVAGLGFLIGQLVGRWGNFFNREAFGYETEIFCRMGLTLNGKTIFVHPTFLYESLWNLIGFLILHFHSKRHRRYQGQYFLYYLLWYGVGRAAIEGLRSDSLWLIPDVIRISQLIGLASAAAALVLCLFNNRSMREGRPPVFGRLPAAEVPDDGAPADDSGAPLGSPSGGAVERSETERADGEEDGSANAPACHPERSEAESKDLSDDSDDASTPEKPSEP